MLPDLYSRWVTDWLGAPPPEEPLATCADCAMCVKGDGRTPTASYFFEPEMKCCVYQPSLPNFLAGRSVGVDTVRARIEAGIGVGPLVLERPPSYDLVHRHTINAAGRTKALRCPHFVTADGTCGIWENRDALCATWFCRHVRGRTGFPGFQTW